MLLWNEAVFQRCRPKVQESVSRRLPGLVQRVDRQLGKPRPVGLDRSERFGWFQTFEASLGERLIDRGGSTLPGYVSIRQLAHDLGGNAEDQAARRNYRPRFHEGHRRDDARLADDGSIRDHRVHANQRVLADAAAVEDRAMADVAIRFYDGVCAGKTMHHAGVLQIASLFEYQAPEISA